MKTQSEIYNDLYNHYKQFLNVHNDVMKLSDDKISRKSNLFAVKFTWQVFIEQNKLNQLSNLQKVQTKDI